MTSSVDVLTGPGTVCRQGEVSLWIGEDVPPDLAGRVLDAVRDVAARAGSDVLNTVKALLTEVPPGSIGSLAVVAVSPGGITAVLHGSAVVQNGRGEAHSGALTSELLDVDVAPDGVIGLWGSARPTATGPGAVRYDLQAGTVRGGGVVIRTADGPAGGSAAGAAPGFAAPAAGVAEPDRLAPPAPLPDPPGPPVAEPPAAAGAPSFEPPRFEAPPPLPDPPVAATPADGTPAVSTPASAGGDATPTPADPDRPGPAAMAPSDELDVPAAAPPALTPPPSARSAEPGPPGEIEVPTPHPGALRPGPNGAPLPVPPVAPPVPEPPRASGGLRLLDLNAPPATPRGPLSLVRDVVGEPPPVDEPKSIREVVHGVRCVNGHFNHQGMLYCRACGIGMVQQSAVLVEGERPSLGVIVMADGSTFSLDDEYLLGREASRDAGVRSIVVDDRRVSRRHALLSLKGWDVIVTDLGSSNGTYVKNPGWPEWVRATPHQPVTLDPGGQIGIGGQVLVYESSARRR
jgi:hypothetical protein